MPFSPFFTRALRYRALRYIVIIISLGFVCLEVSAQTIKYEYDALGRVRVVEDSVNGNRGYDYDAAGNRIYVSGPDLVKPSIPSALLVSNLTNNSARVSWTASTDNVGVSGYEYNLNGGAWNPLGILPSVNLLVLTPSTDYTFVLRSKDAAGNISDSASKSFKTLDIVVSPPGTPSFSNKTTTSVTASWAASATSGVTYEWSINGGSSWTATSSTSAPVSGLAPNTNYTFSVRALSGSVRSGESSAPFKTLGIVVSSPGTPSFSDKTTTSVTATWAASATSGATYEWSINGGSSWTAASSTSVFVSSLAPSTDYTFSVQAIHTGVRSGTSSATFKTLDIVVSPPGTPSFSNKTAASVTATWAASSTSGATYEWSINGGSSWTATSLTSASVNGLVPGTGYTFMVRALYSAVRSTSSATSFTTLDVEPASSLRFTNQATTSITASWSASSTPGATYEYSLYEGGAWYSTSATSVNLTGLTPNSGYNFTVKVLVSGKYSAPVSLTFMTNAIPTGAPGTPSMTGITATSASATWTASSTLNATYEWTIDGWATTGSNTGFPYGLTWNLTNLIPSHDYTFQVRAVKDNVKSTPSSSTFRTADVGLPGTPGFSNKTSSSVTVAWAASPLSGATYEWSINGGASWNSTSSTSVSVGGLASSTGYTFYVRAIHTGVRSSISSAAFTTLDTVVVSPGIPGISNINTASVTASWAASATVGSTYEWSINEGSSWNATSSTSVPVTGLTPYTSYTFSVRAIYSGIHSGASSASFTTLASPLAMVGSLSLSPSSTLMNLQWDAATGSPGADSYEYSLNSGASWINVGSTRYVNVTGLTPNTSYTFYVRAKNALGTSASISNTRSTLPVPLAAPTGAKCEQKWGAGAWQGVWNAVPGAHHYIFKAMNKPEVSVSGTDTGSTPIQQSTKPCVWVQACDASNNCGPVTYFP